MVNYESSKINRMLLGEIRNLLDAIASGIFLESEQRAIDPQYT